MKNSALLKRLMRANPAKQRGVVLVLYAVGMIGVLAVAGLALDASHAMINKTRLQNTVDAAALAAAHTLDNTNDVTQATQAAVAVFAANQAAAGNGELATGTDSGNARIEFSNTLEPFAAGTTPAQFVRVTYENFTMPAWIIQVLGIQNKSVSASAVSGPSPNLGAVCNLVPLIVCGDPAAGAPYWGYGEDQVHVLKSGSQSGSESGPIGPGNFQLARMGGSGGDVVRDNLAGGFEGCAFAGNTIPTEPGNTVGPTEDGLNTRLGMYSGPIGSGDGYLPDVVTETQGTDLEYDDATGNITLDNGATIVSDSSDLDFGFDDYESRIASGNYDYTPPAGAFDRRNLSVVIADCTGSNTGQSDLPILGFGCFFMLQEVKQKGNAAEVYGEFVDTCDADGSFGPFPATGVGPTEIILYNDVDRLGS